jgi:hypothetical protein
MMNLPLGVHWRGLSDNNALSWEGRIDRAREVFDCLEESYRLYPERFRDIRMWIRSYINLPEFSFLVASERMETWQRLYEHVDAYFYGYILQFCQLESAQSVRIPLIQELVKETQTRARKIEREHSFEWLSGSAKRCPLVQPRMLGSWDSEAVFFTKKELLKTEVGRIVQIVSPAQGYIAARGVRAFFKPANEFREGRDEGKVVTFYLGFSYDGLRAWKTEFAKEGLSDLVS